MFLLDSLVYSLFRGGVSLFNAFPLKLRIAVVYLAIRVTVSCSAYRRIAMRNIELAFPDRDRAWRLGVMHSACLSLARLIVTLLCLDKLDAVWVREHVQFPFAERLRELTEQNKENGVIIASGHLGNFEIFAPSFAHNGLPSTFIMREISEGRLGRWFRMVREQGVHIAISRKGAFRKVMKELRRGARVFVLFDQNVKKSHATFVDWFGRPAATTKLVAVAALRTKAPVVVMSIASIGNDHYRIDAEECDLSDFYTPHDKSSDDLINRATQRITDIYLKMICKNPGEWFWFHRRWKTSEDSSKDGEFYSW